MVSLMVKSAPQLLTLLIHTAGLHANHPSNPSHPTTSASVTMATSVRNFPISLSLEIIKLYFAVQDFYLNTVSSVAIFFISTRTFLSRIISAPPSSSFSLPYGLLVCHDIFKIYNREKQHLISSILP